LDPSLRSSPRDEGGGFQLLMLSSDTHPPFRVDVTVLLGEEMRRLGHRVDLILQSDADTAPPRCLRWAGGLVLIGPTDPGTSLPRRIRKHCLGILNDLRVFGAARRHTYDALLVKDKFVSGIWALLAARRRGIPFLYWLSWPYPEEYLLRATDGTASHPFLYRIRGLAFHWLLYRLLLPRARHVFVQSERMRRDVAGQGIPLAKLTAVPMGVRDALLQQPRRPTPEPMQGAPSILYLGTLSRVRRLDFLIRVMAQVHRARPDARLFLVGQGDGPEDEALLHAEVARLGLTDSVKFIGRLPQAEALAYVTAASVCVSPLFPSPLLDPGSPTKLVEYLALGRPVVANDHPEQRLIIEQSEAGLCVPWDEGRFAEAIVTLLADPEGADARGARGREWVARHRVYSVIAADVAHCLGAVTGRGAPASAGTCVALRAR
jgi:glycosyltransferase involved in cell wall biosynthesis